MEFLKKNFFDKAFTIIADVILKILPIGKKEKKSFSYYRQGLSAHYEGKYEEAIKYYFESLELEEDPYDRSYTLYNLGMAHEATGLYREAIEFYHQAFLENIECSSTLVRISRLYWLLGKEAESKSQSETDEYNKKADICSKKSIAYLIIATQLTSQNYDDIRNWLATTGRYKPWIEIDDDF